MTKYDVVIVGGGPAGLSAALVLGLARRSVVVFDAGQPRNAPSRQAHGFLTRDGCSPSKLSQIARRQMAAYPSVDLHQARVETIRKQDFDFEVVAEGGESLITRRLTDRNYQQTQIHSLGVCWPPGLNAISNKTIPNRPETTVNNIGGAIC